MAHKALIILEKYEQGYYVFKRSSDSEYNFMIVDLPEDVEDFGDFVRQTVYKFTGGETVNVDYKKTFSMPEEQGMVYYMVFDACCFTGVKTLKLPYVSSTVVEFGRIASFTNSPLIEFLDLKKVSRKLKPAPPMTKGQTVKKQIIKKTPKVNTNPSILRSLRNGNM